MTMRLMAACVQMTSGPDIAANLANAAGLVREAAGQGARLVCTPENTDVMRADMLGTLALVPAEEDHPALPFFAELARELGVFLSLGSIGVRVASDKIANRSYLFDDKGALVARYDKIHLFDVDLDLYGRTLVVGLVARIREERRFASVEELVARIGVDAALARAIV